MNIGGYIFTHICTIQPKRDGSNTVVAFYPHKDYETSLPLLPFGAGPFCRFSIPDNLPYSGVYAITIDRNQIYYIGETVNLSQRYNQGYGSIHPRACFQGGQATNLRINNAIYHATMAGIAVDLWFYKADDFKAVEADLIPLLKPKWNRLGVTTDFRPYDANQRHGTYTAPASQPKLPRTTTCRKEILVCVQEIIEQTGKNEFTVEDVIRAMHAKGTSYKTITIKLHVTSHMCLTGPIINPKRYDDFEHLGGNRYRLKNLN